MRNTLIALTLGLCSLPSLATTLAEQFARERIVSTVDVALSR